MGSNTSGCPNRRLINALEVSKLSEHVNIFVTADHVLSSNGGEITVAQLFVTRFSEDDFRSFNDMNFLQRQDPKLLARIAEALQRNPSTIEASLWLLHPADIYVWNMRSFSNVFRRNALNNCTSFLFRNFSNEVCNV